MKNKIDHILHDIYSFVLYLFFLNESILKSTLSETYTFRTSTKCLSYRDVRLIESQIKRVKKGRDQL